MEGLIFPTAPTLLALLVGIASLYRFWPQLFISGPRTLYSKKSKTLTPIPELAEDDNDGVFKESDFPEGWWVSKDVFELERRAIFSKARWLYHSEIVSKDFHHLT
jgi:hypothetical protein